MLCSFPVAISFAETCTIPFASISKVTSICGTPRGAGGIPTRSKLPSVLLLAAISRSPWRTWMETAVWPSAAVEKIWLFRVGIVVFLSISFVNTPPNVSIPSESGVTSRSRMSLTSPPRIPPWIAAPIATTSSGFTLLLGSFPKICFTIVCTAGILVEPPTRITSSISEAERPASLSALIHGSLVLLIRCSTIPSNLALVSDIWRCLGPVASAVMNGRLISVD